MRTLLLLTTLASTLALPVHADETPAAFPLWPAGAPGSEARAAEPETLEGTNVCNVHNPSLTPYLPAPEKATGTAVIICPGGGHRKLCLGHEGGALAEWFQAAMPRASSAGRRPTPASSIPTPASLNTPANPSVRSAAAGSPPTRPPCEPVTTIRPASSGRTSEAESTSTMRRGHRPGRPGRLRE